jgi:hypothetical protein
MKEIDKIKNNSELPSQSLDWEGNYNESTYFTMEGFPS